MASLKHDYIMQNKDNRPGGTVGPGSDTPVGPVNFPILFLNKHSIGPNGSILCLYKQYIFHPLEPPRPIRVNFLVILGLRI